LTSRAMARVSGDGPVSARNLVVFHGYQRAVRAAHYDGAA
jgi:hypothetical protein